MTEKLSKEVTVNSGLDLSDKGIKRFIKDNMADISIETVRDLHSAVNWAVKESEEPRSLIGPYANIVSDGFIDRDPETTRFLEGADAVLSLLLQGKEHSLLSQAIEGFRQFTLINEGLSVLGTGLEEKDRWTMLNRRLVD